MKKTAFTTYFFLLSGAIFSQNWSLATISEKFNFQNDTSDIITNTLWIDSVSIENGDSIFHLNRIVTDCDFCPNPNNKLKNQQQFLQETIRKKSDGSYHFQGENSFVIFPHAELGETWLFDTLNNIEASIIELAETPVLGTVDSLKIIQINSGNVVIVLSKNVGIIDFSKIYESSRYLLVGLEEKGVGHLVPNSWDFYDFNVGDVFQFTGYDGHFENQTQYTRKYIIEDFTLFGNTVTYDVKILSEDTYWSWTILQGWNYYEENIQWVFNHDSLNHYVNYYPHQLYETPYEPSEENEVSFVSLFKNENGVLSKCLNNIQDYWDDFPQGFYTQNDATDILELQEVVQYSDIAQIGLGVTNHNLDPFEGWYAHNLEGYVKNGDTVGFIAPDSSFLDNTYEQFFENFNLHPNPSYGIFSLNFKKTFNEDLQAIIFNSNGKIVYKDLIYKGINKFDFDLQDLSKGVYFLNLVGDRRQFSTKVLLH